MYSKQNIKILGNDFALKKISICMYVCIKFEHSIIEYLLSNISNKKLKYCILYLILEILELRKILN